MKDMVVRVVSGDENDANALAEIIRRANAVVAARFGLTPENAPKHPSSCTADWIRDDLTRGVRYILAEVDDRPVGCVGLEKADGGTCYMERLAVRPEFQRQGIGAALVQEFRNLAGQLGYSAIGIGIIAENHELSRWYAAHGFRATETKTFPHLPFTVQFMTGSLTQ